MSMPGEPQFTPERYSEPATARVFTFNAPSATSDPRGAVTYHGAQAVALTNREDGTGLVVTIRHAVGYVWARAEGVYPVLKGIIDLTADDPVILPVTGGDVHPEYAKALASARKAFDDLTTEGIVDPEDAWRVITEALVACWAHGEASGATKVSVLPKVMPGVTSDQEDALQYALEQNDRQLSKPYTPESSWPSRSSTSFGLAQMMPVPPFDPSTWPKPSLEDVQRMMASRGAVDAHVAVDVESVRSLAEHVEGKAPKLYVIPWRLDTDDSPSATGQVVVMATTPDEAVGKVREWVTARRRGELTMSHGKGHEFLPQDEPLYGEIGLAQGHLWWSGD